MHVKIGCMIRENAHQALNIDAAGAKLKHALSQYRTVMVNAQQCI